MTKSGRHLLRTVGVLTASVLTTTGCVSKKYVSQQMTPVNQRLAQLEKQQNDRIAYLDRKEENDIAGVNQRIAGTDRKVAQIQIQTASQGAASRSMEPDTAAINASVNKALNYELVDKADVTFGFNKAVLTSEAKATLNAVADKLRSTPRAVVELAGFTDPIGSANYNLELSRRRAWAVQRYLVAHNVPPRSIHMVGMGEETAPKAFQSALVPDTARASNAERNRLARRVSIRVFGTGEAAAGESESQQ